MENAESPDNHEFLIPQFSTPGLANTTNFSRFRSHNTEFQRKPIRRRSSKTLKHSRTESTDTELSFDLGPTKICPESSGAIDGYAANSNIGLVRERNEDRVSICINLSKSAVRPDWPESSYFGLFDGHGGPGCANFLTSHLHHYIVRDPAFPENPEQALFNGFVEADRAFLQRAANNGDHSGSCAIVLLFVGEECYIANTGDSRALLSSDRGKKVVVLSEDHKPNSQSENLRIVAAGGTTFFSGLESRLPSGKLQTFGCYRVYPGNLAVSRSFGDIKAKSPVYEGNPRVVVAEPEIKKLKICDEYNFVVMASDGIFDCLSNEEVVKAVWNTEKVLSPLKLVESGVERVIRMAFEKETTDNVTVVVICLKGFKRELSKYYLDKYR